MTFKIFAHKLDTVALQKFSLTGQFLTFIAIVTFLSSCGGGGEQGTITPRYNAVPSTSDAIPAVISPQLSTPVEVNTPTSGLINQSPSAVVSSLPVPITTTNSTTPTATISNAEWFAASKYGLIFHYLPRGGADPILAGPDGTWNNTVNGFKVADFVNNVQKTGAAYVIFSVGQNSGFYVSPSAEFDKRVGSKPGQFASERDLILELSNALEKINVKLFVYSAVLGPIAASDDYIYVRANFPSGDPFALEATRTSLNATLGEWSKRWGTKVAGWWLDGCYPQVTGYGNPVDGEKNIDTMLKTIKLNNPDAMVTCNPSAQIFKAVSVEQNYMAGEEVDMHRYPDGSTLEYKGKKQIWHTIFALGKDWGDGSVVRYPGEQLASYVNHVANRGGVVTVDVGIKADGSFFNDKLIALEKVKAILRDKQPFTDTGNLALYRPTRIVDNLTGVDLPFNGNTYAHWGTYAVDGNQTGRTSVPGFYYAWSLEIDLDNPTQFARAAVTFPQDKFSSNFELLVSNDRQTWRSVWSSENNNLKITEGGKYAMSFPATTGRYVRLKSNSPNGPDQTGGQMEILELELYAK